MENDDSHFLPESNVMKINSSAIYAAFQNITSKAKTQPESTRTILMNLKGIKNTGVIFTKVQEPSAKQADFRPEDRAQPGKLKRLAPQPTAEMKAAAQLKKALQNHSLETLADKLNAGLKAFEKGRELAKDNVQKRPLSEKEAQQIKIEIAAAQKMFTMHAEQRRDALKEPLPEKMHEPLNLRALKPRNVKQRAQLKDMLTVDVKHSEKLDLIPSDKTEITMLKAAQVKQALGNRFFKSQTNAFSKNL